MIIIYLIFSSISLSFGLNLQIGGLFDTDIEELQQSFECAVEVANNERLADARISFDHNVVTIPYGNEYVASKSLCRLLKDGISAVIGPASPSSSLHCMNICDAKEMPYIDVERNGNTKLPVVNLHPHPDAIAQIFFDLINATNWEGFTIIYESAPWLPRIAELLKFYSTSYDVTVRRINITMNDRNYRPVLRRVKMSSDTNIVVDCSVETLPEFLKQAQQVGLMTGHHQFFITSMDFHTLDLEPYQHSGTNITGIRLLDPENPLMGHIRNFTLKSEAYNPDEESEAQSKGLNPNSMTVRSALVFDAVLLMAEVFKQFDNRQLKIRKLPCNANEAWENGNSISNFMRNTIVQGLTGEIKFDNQGYRSEFAVDVIQLTSSGITKIATWNATNTPRLHVTQEIKEVDAIDDSTMRNKTFIVITALTPPYGQLKNSSSQLFGNDRFEGFGIDLIHELSQMLGFKYEFTLQEDGVYGSKDNVTGEWNGMIREVIDGRADLAITDLTITAERESGVDFTMPFMNLGISILFTKPTKEPPSTFSFMSPFSTEVWIALGAAYIGVSLCLFILGRLSPSEWDNPYPCIEEPKELENQFSLSNAMWFTAGALLQQGSEIAPKAPSTRAVASIWWFFTLIMVSSYTANLAAFLVVENKSSPIKQVEDLKDCHKPEYQCPVHFGAKESGSTLNFFKEADHGTYRNMYLYMTTHDVLTKNNEQGLDRVKNGSYAFLMESSSIEYLVERHCTVTQLGGLLDEKGYGIAMRKNSNYRSALSEAVLKLQEQGRLTALKTKWWKEKTRGNVCTSKETGGDAEELDMENMNGVFYVLLVGSAFASLYGIAEWLIIVFLRAKRYNVSFKTELMDDFKFVVKCSGNTKTVRHRKSMSMDSKQSLESDRSIASKDSSRHRRDNI